MWCVRPSGPEEDSEEDSEEEERYSVSQVQRSRIRDDMLRGRRGRAQVAARAGGRGLSTPLVVVVEKETHTQLYRYTRYFCVPYPYSIQYIVIKVNIWKRERERQDRDCNTVYTVTRYPHSMIKYAQTSKLIKKKKSFFFFSSSMAHRMVWASAPGEGVAER